MTCERFLHSFDAEVDLQRDWYPSRQDLPGAPVYYRGEIDEAPHQHDEQAVIIAVELAQAEGVPTKTHELNLLHRLVDGKVVGGPPLDTPQATLRREPKANVERYDGLRSQICGGRHGS